MEEKAELPEHAASIIHRDDMTRDEIAACCLANADSMHEFSNLGRLLKAAAAIIAHPANAEGGEREKVLAVLNRWFDGTLRIDPKSELVSDLAALSSPVVGDVAAHGSCFECRADLVGPFCPFCNPEIGRALSPPLPQGDSGAGGKFITFSEAGDYGNAVISPDEPAEGCYWTLIGVGPNEVQNRQAQAIVAAINRASPTASTPPIDPSATERMRAALQTLVNRYGFHDDGSPKDWSEYVEARAALGET